MFSVSVTSLIYSSGNHRMWTRPVPLVLETVPIRTVRISWKLRLHVEILFHLYFVLWHSNSNKDSTFLYLAESKKTAKGKKKKKSHRIIIRTSPFHHETQIRGDSWFKQNLHSKRLSKLPKLSYFVIYWGGGGGLVKQDLLSILWCRQIIFFFAHIRSPE